MLSSIYDGEMRSAGINAGKFLGQGCVEDSTLLAGKKKGEIATDYVIGLFLFC